jgi:hypothetical protein
MKGIMYLDGLDGQEYDIYSVLDFGDSQAWTQ